MRVPYKTKQHLINKLSKAELMELTKNMIDNREYSLNLVPAIIKSTNTDFNVMDYIVYNLFHGRLEATIDVVLNSFDCEEGKYPSNVEYFLNIAKARISRFNAF